jgi:hypothetical protein
MDENASEGLLVRVEPLQRAKEVLETMVEGVLVMEGALQLDVGPAYAGRSRPCWPRGA